MKLRKLLVLATSICGMSVMSSTVALSKTMDIAGCARPRTRQFKVFNALSFENQPNLDEFAMSPIHIIDRGIWKPGVSRRGPPDLKAVKRYISTLPDDGAPVVLDFEDFPLIGSDVEARDSVEHLLSILRTFRKAAPSRTLGFYSMVPIFNYWHSINGRSDPEYEKWQRQDDRILPLANRVDAMFPSLYTHYTDRSGWKRFAIEQVCEARRLSNKPVYVFLWPRYEEGDRVDQTIDPDAWREELNLSYRYADGIVLWGGWNLAASHKIAWRDDAPWWIETKHFLARIGK